MAKLEVQVVQEQPEQAQNEKKLWEYLKYFSWLLAKGLKNGNLLTQEGLLRKLANCTAENLMEQVHQNLSQTECSYSDLSSTKTKFVRLSISNHGIPTKTFYLAALKSTSFAQPYY